MDANRSVEVFRMRLWSSKPKKLHSIKIYYFWTFIHSFTHNHSVHNHVVRDHKRAPYILHHSHQTTFDVTFITNQKSNNATTQKKKKTKRKHPKTLGVWKLRTICPAVNHWNVKRVSRNDIITMSYVVLLIYAIMIGHWQWNIVPHEVYLFTFNFRSIHHTFTYIEILIFTLCKNSDQMSYD